MFFSSNMKACTPKPEAAFCESKELRMQSLNKRMATSSKPIEKYKQGKKTC